MDEKCGEHHITTASFPMKNSVTTPFGRISKHLENWLLKNILKKKEIKHIKKSRCKDFSEDFKKKKKNETHLIPSSSHSLTSFLKIRIYEFECYYVFHGSYKWIIMHEKLRRPDSNGFQLKWRIGIHGNWKNQNPGGHFEATR